MAQASRELASLPGVGTAVASKLLDAGFRSIEELVLASLEDLTSIDGISEDVAIQIHDAAEIALEARLREEEEAASADVADGVVGPDEGDRDEVQPAAEDRVDATGRDAAETSGEA